MEKRQNARFIKPMECLPVENIPEGDNWTYELKLDGYRLQAVKAGGKVTLYSRRGIDLTKRFEYVAKALAGLTDDTVIDGELVALDEEGKPNFNLLQNFRSAESHIVFYAFDILIHNGHDLKQLPLSRGSAAMRCEHLSDLQKRNIRSANILAVFQQYRYVPKHTVREQLLQRISYVYADFLFCARYIGGKVGFVR